MRPRLANHAMLGGLLGALVALLTAPSVARAEKADVVQMSNGDRLVCEIQDLDQGRLRVKTEGFGTVFAEWSKVVRIESARRFEVQETTSGTLLYGPLKPAPAEGRLVVGAGGGDVELAITRVARIHVLQSGFWDRIEGSLGLGGSYTRANGLIQLNPAIDATYVGRGFQAGIDVTATWTRQNDKDDASRAVGALSYTRFRGERWLVFGQLTAERNSELGLERRLLASGGAGGFLHLGPHSRVLFGAGLTASKEKTQGEEDTSNLEGLLTGQWQVFAYSFPETRLKILVSLYPGLTDWGRVRGNLDVQVKREIVHDFSIGLTLYESFDNRPAAGAKKNDWGATLALSWTY